MKNSDMKLGHSTEHQVTNEEREQTKRVVYAVMYGAGMNKLEQVLQVNPNEARKILNTFTGKFPQIKNFSQRLVRRARDQGFVTSLSGRRRLFPNISSSDAKLRLQSERQAVNFLIQGSAADVCKVAMIRTQQAMNREALQAELMLQIHDELVWEVPDTQLQKFKELVQEVMEGTKAYFKITLPLPVALASGKTWADVS
ncbi:hypothetical protein B566_EDAN000931 [Ephemera danica]|nr:hypothetical protein B566_EDAN000931 [Ephemera danica]